MCAPRLLADEVQVRSSAPYSWSVVRISSPSIRAAASARPRSARRHVREVDDLVGVGVEVLGQACACRLPCRPCSRRPMNSTGCRSSSRCHRLVPLEHGPGARAEGAVVQERDVGIEQKLGAQRQVALFGGLVIDKCWRWRRSSSWLLGSRRASGMPRPRSQQHSLKQEVVVGEGEFVEQKEQRVGARGEAQDGAPVGAAPWPARAHRGTAQNGAATVSQPGRLVSKRASR